MSSREASCRERRSGLTRNDRPSPGLCWHFRSPLLCCRTASQSRRPRLSMRTAGTAVLQALDQNTPRRVERAEREQPKGRPRSNMAGKRKQIPVSEDEDGEEDDELFDSEDDSDDASPVSVKSSSALTDSSAAS